VVLCYRYYLLRMNCEKRQQFMRQSYKALAECDIDWVDNMPKALIYLTGLHGEKYAVKFFKLHNNVGSMAAKRAVSRALTSSGIRN